MATRVPKRRNELPAEFRCTRRLFDIATDAATLRVLQGPLKDTIFVLPLGELSVGRDPRCELAIAVASLSRRHCQFFLNEWELIVRDAGSTHGIRVNGELCEQTRLYDGDMIDLGGLTVKFEIRSRNATSHEPRAIFPNSKPLRRKKS